MSIREPDVDALGGFVGQDHRRLPEERAGDGDLLLVAAGQELDRLIERRRADLELLDELFHRGALGPSAQPSDPAEPPQRLHGGVDPDAEDTHQRLALAIAGQQHDPGAHRLVGRDQRQLLAGADDPAGPRRDPPRQAVEELRLAVALGAGDPHDLAGAQREAHRTEGLTLQGVDDEHVGGLDRRRRRRRERRLERASDDPLDQLAARSSWRRRTSLGVARRAAP